jgi:hypothetical protein
LSARKKEIDEEQMNKAIIYQINLRGFEATRKELDEFGKRIRGFIVGEIAAGRMPPMQGVDITVKGEFTIIDNKQDLKK